MKKVLHIISHSYWDRAFFGLEDENGGLLIASRSSKNALQKRSAEFPRCSVFQLRVS